MNTKLANQLKDSPLVRAVSEREGPYQRPQRPLKNALQGIRAKSNRFELRRAYKKAVELKQAILDGTLTQHNGDPVTIEHWGPRLLQQRIRLCKDDVEDAKFLCELVELGNDPASASAPDHAWHVVQPKGQKSNVCVPVARLLSTEFVNIFKHAAEFEGKSFVAALYPFDDETFLGYAIVREGPANIRRYCLVPEGYRPRIEWVWNGEN